MQPEPVALLPLIQTGMGSPAVMRISIGFVYALIISSYTEFDLSLLFLHKKNGIQKKYKSPMTRNLSLARKSIRYLKARLPEKPR